MAKRSEQGKTLRLILGDQLNWVHSWFSSVDSEVVYLMMEVRSEASYVTHHLQKLLCFFFAMRSFAQQLRAEGHQVRYIALDDPANQQSIEANVEMLLNSECFSRFEYQEPDEYRVDVLLADLSHALRERKIVQETAMLSSEHFLTTRQEVAAHFHGKKARVMESFYRAMRVKHRILLEPGAESPSPLGGQWNFDLENRGRFDREHQPPVPPTLRPAAAVSSLVKMISAQGIQTLGTVSPERFIWPTTREQALAALERFVRERLPHFGRYQDAMDSSEPLLFHSLLSFPLNVKLISPREVIDRAVLEFERAGGAIALPSIEGFVRQILGWREYLRGLYWEQMPKFADLNFFGNTRPLPGFFWTGKTDMNCLRHAITQSLELGYAHHIQRLMVTGSFAMLAGIDPDEVDRWYLGIYIDAIEWVELMNTRGMSQFADGGVVATKPYCGSANYIKKMSNYCTGCRYQSGERITDNACPLNALYWDFHLRNRDKLSKNPRIGMVYRTIDKMPEEERHAIQRKALAVLNDIENL